MIGRSRTVTSLVSDRRKSGNLVVEVDGARFASLPAEVVQSLGLEAGQELDDQRHERLVKAAENEAAYHVALRILAAMPRAVTELSRRLRQRGHSISAATDAVQRLESCGLLDDEEFARHFTRVRISRGHGPPRILTDLLNRGVERRLAERAIDEVVAQEGIDPNREARVVAEKRASQLGGLSPDVKKRRLLAYLNRRGFRGYEVTEMVDELVRP